MKKFTLLITLTVFSFQLFCFSELEGNAFTCSPLVDYFARNWLSASSAARANTGAGKLDDVCNTLINPAAFWLDGDFQGYFEIMGKNSAIYDDDFDAYPKSTVFMIAMAKQISVSMTLGLLYTKPQSFEVDFGFVTTNTYYGPFTRELIYDRATTEISLPINYTMNEQLYFGASINILFYEGSAPFWVRGYMSYYSKQAEIAAMIFQPMFGILYKINKAFSVGAALKMGVRKKVNFSLEKISNGNFDPNDFPMRVNAGIVYKCMQIPLEMLLDINFENTGKYNEMENKLDFSLGFEYRLRESLTLKAGVMSFFDNRDLDYQVEYYDEYYDYWIDQDEYDLNFLSTGFEYKYRALSITGAVISSELLDKDYGHSQFSIGIGVRFK